MADMQRNNQLSLRLTIVKASQELIKNILSSTFVSSE